MKFIELTKLEEDKFLEELCGNNQFIESKININPSFIKELRTGNEGHGSLLIMHDGKQIFVNESKIEIQQLINQKNIF